MKERQVILALDIATKTGWACDVDSGVIDLTPKRGESAGMKTIRFNSRLREMIDLIKPTVIAYERPAGQHASSVIDAAKLIGVLEVVAHGKGIELSPYSASQIKKHATGKGNSGKPAMIAAAEDKWPDTKIIDDNHADALWLLDLAKYELYA